MHEPIATAIDGLLLYPLKEIATPGGSVLHMLRADAPFFTQFGELYFSEVLPGAIKGWKYHREQTQHMTVPRGQLTIMLHDARPHSPSYATSITLHLGRPHAYALLRIPPHICYAFSATGTEAALIANCTDIPHAAEESVHIPLDDPRAPCPWAPEE